MSDLGKIFWKSHQFEPILTEDGSPTLRSFESPNLETMHHWGGAYSETQMIYGTPLREFLDGLQKTKPHILSVGLGIGYNEILVAFEALTRSLCPQDIYLVSYEAVPILRESFIQWIQKEAFAGSEIYDLIASFFSKTYPLISVEQVQNFLTLAYQNQTFEIRGALTSEMNLSGEYHLVFYDAFSSKTSPHLWDEVFLTKMFRNHTRDSARVTTYACTGNLKRALKASGFQVVIRDGFRSNRNSTLGRRSVKSLSSSN